MKIKIILLFFVCFEFKFFACSSCGTNQLKITPYVLDIGDIQRRKLAYEYTPIDIKVDMTYLESQNILNDEQFTNLEKIFEEVTGYFKTILSVQKISLKNLDLSKYINEVCGISKFDLGDENFDLLILPEISDDLNKNILAAGTPCITLINHLR